MWERACSRRRWISHPVHRLTHRFREQARSHSFDRFSAWDSRCCAHISTDGTTRFQPWNTS
ncbi:hypothetical protein C9382_14800 [Pseudomonas aylmerensis]|uniref:Uncharacterized protein n=1 Tax=Pseudomonas aylmerensis TaxID=1869229 RepID=A0A2T4FY25_9PSED|nr:hypothetical protein C9382_14800 [Pseudomonas aylmerensis]